MQLFNKLQGQYDQLWKYIIRPARTPYPESALGPETFCLENIKVKRNSFQLINDRGQVFFGSHFVPLQSSSYPCVIYLHGNSSNQTEGMEYLSDLIKNNMSLCTFDFSACGNSEGEYVSLGYNEWKDVEEVVMHIKAKQKVTKIALWGRSMGAVTALRYAGKNPNAIAVAIYDSPFKSLKSLISDLCKKNSKIPMFILSGALKIISSTIKQKANFDIYDLDPLKNEAPLIKTPGFFIVSEQDELIPFQHTKMLFEAYKTKKKQIRIVKGQHNGTRPESCIKDAIKYLRKYLLKDEKQQKHPEAVGGMKAQQIDFFNDDTIDDYPNKYSEQGNNNQSRVDKQIDFFNEQGPNSKEIENFERQFNQSTQNKNNENSLFGSLNDMFAGVFGNQAKTKKPTEINDGYQELRNRISNSISNNLTNNNSKLQKQLKSYDDSFEKMFEANPNAYIW